MRAVCAWCQTDLGGRPGPEGAVTHGICPACLARVRAERYERDAARLAEGHSLSVIRCECPCGCEIRGTVARLDGGWSVCSECWLRGHDRPEGRVMRTPYFSARGEEERPC